VNPLSSTSSTQHEDLREIHKRMTFFKIGLLLVIILLGLRVWYLQIKEGDYYRDLSENNRIRPVALEPARGLIYDRNGLLLANNVPTFNLYVTLEDVRDRTALIQRLAALSGLDEARLQKKLLGRAGRVKVKHGLTLREAAIIEAHRLDLPGVVIQPESQRNYPAGSVAAHVIGYVGEVSEAQLATEEFADLRQGNVVGQYGIENTYDRFIHGREGQKLVEVDAVGREKRTVSVRQPEAGNDLYLTIDLRLQEVAESLLGGEAGAIVAIDPTSGEVLALASRPTFDPNTLSHDLTPRQWAQIVQDEGSPLTNRATQGQYPPGSTFKIVLAAAALETNTLSPYTRIACGGGYQFGRRLYRDWKKGGHGVLDVTRALIDSCDVFFYTVGQRLGIDTIASYADEFGLGRPTGIELPSERAGIVPSEAWKQKSRGVPWLPGETISASIGQGYVTVTPMQMAHLIATVANGGVSFRPHVVRAIAERATGRTQEFPRVPDSRLPVKPETLQLIRHALEGVVTQGTARRAHSSLVSIAGKTGTAQMISLRPGHENEPVPKKLRDHAWFVSYAPVDAPRIAVAVLVEHMGHGGSAAAPLAKEMIEAFMRLSPREPLTADDRTRAGATVAMRDVHD